MKGYRLSLIHIYITGEALYGKIDFLDDASELAVGKLAELEQIGRNYEEVFCCIGNNQFRKELLEKAERLEMKVPVLIHPTAYISPSAVVKAGTVVEPGAIINSNSVIEEGCIILSLIHILQKQHKISPAIAWLTIQKFIIFYCPLDGEHTNNDNCYWNIHYIKYYNTYYI